jgi:hypothetical protein
MTMNRMRRVIASAVAVLLAATLAAAPAAASAEPQPAELHTIRPGEEVVVDSPIRVNLVMVGYQPEAFDVDRLLVGLPATSRPVVGQPARRYGVLDEVGLEHRYEYVPRFAGAQFDDAFFAHLAATGTTAPAALHTQWYNDQQHNVLDVPSEYLHVDAVATEQWLEQQAARRLGVAPEDYTVFLINWWGRPDFRFHVYQANGEPDPDTGIDQGAQPWAQLMSWGGSTGRSWFLDLSAGPEYWQTSFEVDTADVTGDGEMDYRLPPVWEYGNTAGYRPFDDLEGDLASAVRHVAINGLFTASPMYDPTHYVPAPDGARVVDIALFQGDPGQDALDLIQPDVIGEQLTALAPSLDTQVRVADRPLTEEERRTLHITGGTLQEDDCWNRYGSPGAQLFCWFTDRAEQYWPPAASGDAVVRGLTFTLTDADFEAFGNPGLALDDRIDGTPSLFSTSASPYYQQYVGGHTHRVLHSGGHMLGLWHGYEGYDSEAQTFLQPVGDLYFMWLGDAVQSPMSYLFNHHRFGVFNRDNLDRWMVSGLLNRANRDSEAILQSPSGGDREVRRLLRQADRTFARSLDTFARGWWDRAAALAIEAYDDVQRAAARAGTTRVKDSHDRYASAPAPAPQAAGAGHGPETAGPGAAAGTAGRPCAVPADADLPTTSLPPGCARAAAASPSAPAPAPYCSLAPPPALSR